MKIELPENNLSIKQQAKITEMMNLAQFREFIRENDIQSITGSLIQHLRELGFFTAPAGKLHHGAFPGGLYQHSMQVIIELQDMTNRLGLKWSREESPIIIGLLHDICKVDEYIMDLEGDEVKIEFKKHGDFRDHGEASALMAQQFAIESGDFILTKEELMCIRYHMGAFTDQKDWEFYSRAIENYPNVLYTHTADMIASKIKGK